MLPHIEKLFKGRANFPLLLILGNGFIRALMVLCVHALLEVRTEHDYAKLVYRRSDRADLGKDVDAMPFAFNHLLDAVNLTGNACQPKLRLVQCAFVHPIIKTTPWR